MCLLHAPPLLAVRAHRTTQVGGRGAAGRANCLPHASPPLTAARAHRTARVGGHGAAGCACVCASGVPSWVVKPARTSCPFGLGAPEGRSDMLPRGGGPPPRPSCSHCPGAPSGVSGRS
eukprot:2727075-Pleurochrysis_carterae.AAC.1